MKKGMFLFLVIACEPPPSPPPQPEFINQTVCAKSEVKEFQICKTDEDHALGGAIAGFFIAGPIGAVAGAVAGNGSGETTCHMESRQVCVKQEVITVQNPKYVKP